MVNLAFVLEDYVHVWILDGQSELNHDIIEDVHDFRVVARVPRVSGGTRLVCVLWMLVRCGPTLLPGLFG